MQGATPMAACRFSCKAPPVKGPRCCYRLLFCRKPRIWCLVGSWPMILGPWSCMRCGFVRRCIVRDFLKIPAGSGVGSRGRDRVGSRGRDKSGSGLGPRSTGLCLCLDDLPSWATARGPGPGRRGARTAVLVPFHLFHDRFDAVADRITQHAIFAFLPGAVLTLGRHVLWHVVE